ncbi:MAG TPA: PmoA family protein [Panacibacter sp.]|nr:PmoA family protein [Panacibacter sp.]HNP44350.1 PmoA family protein [Panacibacter sp.]
MYDQNFIGYRPSIVLFGIAVLFCTGLRGQPFEAKKTKAGIEITEHGKKVLFYQVQPTALDGKYERSGYIHPLYSLDEHVLTEDFPEDHPYHRGIFWAWHQIMFNGRQVADGWTCDSISWDVTKTQIKNGKGSISLVADVLWKAALTDSNRVPVFREHTSITVNQSTSQYRAIDFDILLSPLKDNLQIGGSPDYKGYGGFCLRLKLPADIGFFSADSVVTAKDSAVWAGPWMDFTGSFDGAAFPKSGVAVFPGDHALSRQWILRKQKSMQNIVYPGNAAVPVPVKGLRLRYRVLIHKNELSNIDLENLYNQYVRDLQ